ncbi:glycosyltransferase [Prochlorococcus marinus]|uniref:glycosyltransferase n=1 Tax=Prochlorococcus TaxID=1218 RepID=UPI000A9AE1E5|nr:glycosyltransferase [Prochlorococcus marinus]
MSTDPPLILVVGMHRSGTSLLGSILETLGVAMPGPLIPGDIHNPDGYFERSDITALQEELLIDLGRWWPSAAGLQPLANDWMESPRAQRAANCLKRLLSADLHSQTNSWAIKDPRTSLLLPLWKEVCNELTIPLKLLLAVRNPAEVVVSLVERDGGTAAMDEQRASGLWLRHHQQLLHDSDGLPLYVLDYGRWFSDAEAQIEALAAFCQPQGIAPCQIEQAAACIKPQHRRSQTRAEEISLNRSVNRWYRHLRKAANTGDSAALRTWSKREHQASRSQAETHPWQAALDALGASNPSALEHWMTQGIPESSLRHLSALNHPGFPGSDPSAHDGPLLPTTLHLELIGADLEQWHSHLWINQLPIAANTKLTTNAGVNPQATLHLQPLSVTATNPALLLALSRRERVFDPDPTQLRLLRLLGVNAEPLPARLAGHWLNSPTESISALGLPNPNALASMQTACLCLGTSSDPNWLTPPAGVMQLPCFPPAPALQASQAKLLAQWIKHCQQLGLALARLNPEPYERHLFRQLDVPCFEDPISPEELLKELQWRSAGQPASPCVKTPIPAIERLWEHTTATSPRAAICISSFNYADRLIQALNSSKAQTLQELELIVVDDASNDDSVKLCLAWLEQHGSRFCGGQLIRHHTNGGLASARNSAFAAAHSPWCWVLDADNQIDPTALEHCLYIAETSPASTAVVHPLIRILNDAGQPIGLVGKGHAWQREQLQHGNAIDAMALIRRSVWQTVGGYSHIPGGWEDFDFWCKLIAADFHGVICPEVLATYRQHGDSMLQSQTNQRQRRLSRLLQERHPWLQLAYAKPDR